MKNDASCVKELADSVKHIHQSVQMHGDILEQQIRKVLHLQEAALQRVFEDRIIRSLRFDNQDSRREQIREPQGHTFSWIFNDDDSDNYSDDSSIYDSDIATFRNEDQKRRESSSRLLTWLSSGSIIFHVSGKLGSGKSTLMRFLYSHPRARVDLTKWAGKPNALRNTSSPESLNRC